MNEYCFKGKFTHNFMETDNCIYRSKKGQGHVFVYHIPIVPFWVFKITVMQPYKNPRNHTAEFMAIMTVP